VDILLFSPDPIVFGPPVLFSKKLGVEPHEMVKYYGPNLDDIITVWDLNPTDYRMVDND
jgi:hypothetical protein